MASLSADRVCAKTSSFSDHNLPWSFLFIMKFYLYIGSMYECTIVCHIFDSFSDVLRALKVVSLKYE